jgi:hypothetical protein
MRDDRFVLIWHVRQAVGESRAFAYSGPAGIDVERTSQTAALDASSREGSGPRVSTSEGTGHHERPRLPSRRARSGLPA